MCQLHSEEQTSVLTNNVTSTPLINKANGLSNRVCVWNLPQHNLCSVIGTCISLVQLREFKSRFKAYTQDMPLKTDYELHACCVWACSTKNPISIHINKWFGKQYKTFVSKVRSLKTDQEIEQLWKSIDQANLRELSGFFWAIVGGTHASQALKNKIYGEVHMISHLTGQTHNKELQTKADLIQQQLETIAKRERSLDKNRRKIDEQQLLLCDLKQQLSDSNQLIVSSVEIPESEQNDKVERNIEFVIETQKLHIVRLQQKLNEMKNLLNKQKFTAKEFLTNSANDEVDSQTELAEPKPEQIHLGDLQGKKILYVGGYSRHQHIFKEFTEKANGQFLYHDGGKQQSEQQLSEMVKKADAIFCPIDCISHSAVGRIKSLSRDKCKDCIFLRSASVSSFKSSISDYAI